MRSIISFVAILASHALAIELVKGQLNGLDRRQTANFCGVDNAGDNLWCIDSSCCASSDTGIWSCYGPDDQCCETGYTCPNGSQCYLESDLQYCVEGSNTVAATSGAAPQTSAGSVSPSETTTGNTPATTKPITTGTTTATGSAPKTSSSHAGGVGRAADALAKVVQLAGAVALLL